MANEEIFNTPELRLRISELSYEDSTSISITSLRATKNGNSRLTMKRKEVKAKCLKRFVPRRTKKQRKTFMFYKT